MSETVLKIEALTKTYDLGKRNVQALVNLNLEVKKRRIRRDHGSIRIRQNHAAQRVRMHRQTNQRQSLLGWHRRC